MKTNNLSLGTKVYVTQSLMAALLLALGVASAIGMTELDSKLQLVTASDSRKMELSGRLAAAVAAAESGQRGMILGALTGNAQQVQSNEQKIRQSREILRSALRNIEPLLYSDEGRRIYADLKAQSEEWTQLLPAFEGHLRGQRFDEATKMQVETFAPLFSVLEKRATAMIDLQRSLMTKSTAGATSTMQLLRVFSIILCLVAGGVALASFLVIRKANTGLRRIAREISEGSRQVASAAQQVSGASQALAQGASEQAATLEETSASTEEINSMTQKNAENASTAATETEKADHLLKETDLKLNQMIGSMKEINTSSEKISKIIRVIDEIAFQTNILALNAAVEAARAGEAGMGFAVVADEVRNLAQRCAQAAKDTSDLIEESIVRSNEGKLRLDEVAASVTRVFENAARIRVLANEVHVGSQEQARGIEQISRAVAQMQQVTQTTAASAEESASAGEEMSAQAHSLEDAVERLRALVGGDAGPESQAGLPAAAGYRPAAKPNRSALPGVARHAPVHRAQIPMDDSFQEF